MKNKKIFIFIMFLVFSFFATPVMAGTSSSCPARLKGQILLQVQSRGEAWYINPVNSKRYYLGRPDDAFNIMRNLGLGIRHSILENSNFPAHTLGRILIDVDDRGKAYYISPRDKQANYLGKPADAFEVMKRQGLGITNADIAKIPIGHTSNSTIIKQTTGSNEEIEAAIIEAINKEREARGLSKLRYNSTLAQAGENHARDMLALNYFAHNRDGKQFYEFATELNYKYRKVGENLATGYRSAEGVVDGWMNSEGHRNTILGDYEEVGVGVEKNSNGSYLASAYFATAQ